MSKQLPWFRLYTRTVDDDKLKLLAFEDRWHFVALLCLKGEGLLDKGDTPSLLMRKAAVKLGLDVRTLEEVARRLAEVGLIEQATLQPVKWDGLQMRSDTDTTAAQRKQRQREREKAGKAAPGNDVTAGHTQDTDMSRVTGTDVTRTDTDTDLDTDTQVGKPEKELDPVGSHQVAGAPASAPPPAAPTAKAAMSKGDKAKGTRLAEEWVLPKRWGDWALQEHTSLTEADVRREAARFADHWRATPGAKGRKSDWEATWRNWIRRAIELQAPRAGAAGLSVDPAAPVETFAQRAARQRVEESTPLVARKAPGALNPIEQLAALGRNGPLLAGGTPKTQLIAGGQHAAH